MRICFSLVLNILNYYPTFKKSFLLKYIKNKKYQKYLFIINHSFSSNKYMTLVSNQKTIKNLSHNYSIIDYTLYNNSTLILILKKKQTSTFFIYSYKVIIQNQNTLFRFTSDTPLEMKCISKEVLKKEISPTMKIIKNSNLLLFSLFSTNLYSFLYKINDDSSFETIFDMNFDESFASFGFLYEYAYFNDASYSLKTDVVYMVNFNYKKVFLINTSQLSEGKKSYNYKSFDIEFFPDRVLIDSNSMFFIISNKKSIYFSLLKENDSFFFERIFLNNNEKYVKEIELYDDFLFVIDIEYNLYTSIYSHEKSQFDYCFFTKNSIIFKDMSYFDCISLYKRLSYYYDYDLCHGYVFVEIVLNNDDDLNEFEGIKKYFPINLFDVINYSPFEYCFEFQK